MPSMKAVSRQYMAEIFETELTKFVDGLPVSLAAEHLAIVGELWDLSVERRGHRIG